MKAFSPLPPFTVVKVGGSLLEWPELPDRLNLFLKEQIGDRGRCALIVGGGKSVDVLRDLDRIHGLGTADAHHLAIRTLDLTAAILARLLIHSFVVESEPALCACWEAGNIPVLAPSRFLRDLCGGTEGPLPESWEVTSDSIAAWIADRLGSDRLILLKSAHLRDGLSRTEAAAEGLVDSHFPFAARRLKDVAYRNLRDDGGGIITLAGDD